jgi:ankyrin repeat protein
MSQPLPVRANLDWLKKVCKERLAALRAEDPKAKLSDAQLAIARAYGFRSWRALRTHVVSVREQLDTLVPSRQENAAAAAAIAPDDPDVTQLFAAIEAGDTATVESLLRRRPALGRARNEEGQTPLHSAARYNDPRLGVLLLAFDADPEAVFGQSAHTALSWAVTCNALEFARTLVQAGVRPDLFCAAGSGSLEHVRKWFDDRGELLPNAARTGSSRFAADGSRLPCPPPSATEQISDALYIACRSGQPEVVKFLLTKQPDLSFKAYMGGTALHWAYFGGSAEVIAMLLERGADRSARDDVLGCTPQAFGICAPASWGMAFLVRERLAANPSLASFMDGRTSALHEAARAGHLAIVELLLEAGAPPLLRDGDGNTPVEIAVDREHSAVAEKLQRAVSQT